MPDSDTAVRVFFSYAHDDEKLWKEFETAIAPLQRSGAIAPWSDHKIIAGQPWRKEILAALRSADIIVLLISPSFLASDYCCHEEMIEALRLARLGAAVVIPVLIRECMWDGEPFAEFQMLPRGGHAIDSKKKRERDAAWKSVAEGLRKAVEAVPQRKEVERSFDKTPPRPRSEAPKAEASGERPGSKPSESLGRRRPWPGSGITRTVIETALLTEIAVAAGQQDTADHHDPHHHGTDVHALDGSSHPEHTADQHHDPEHSPPEHADHSDIPDHGDDHSVDVDGSHHH